MSTRVSIFQQCSIQKCSHPYHPTLHVLQFLGSIHHQLDAMVLLFILLAAKQDTSLRLFHLFPLCCCELHCMCVQHSLCAAILALERKDLKISFAFQLNNCTSTQIVHHLDFTHNNITMICFEANMKNKLLNIERVLLL